MKQQLRQSGLPQGREWNSRVGVRRAFTLIELLVVIAVIVLLLVITVTVFGRLITTARERATLATIKKIHENVYQRALAIDRDLKRGRYRMRVDLKVSTMGISESAATTLVRKELMREHFPQVVTDLPESPPGDPAQYNNSAELLYYVLSEGEDFGTDTGVDEFTSTEVTDTDGDGLLEFVDAWNKPLRFYRWPTRLYRPNGRTDNVTNAYASMLTPTVTTTMMAQDPDDPLGELHDEINSPNPNGLKSAYPDADAFEIVYHTLDTFHPFLIISAGADETLGLNEPGDVANFGHLARPTDETITNGGDSAINDNITNRQPAGG